MWLKLAMALEVRLKALIYRLYSSCPTCLVNNEYIVFYISTFSTLRWLVQECAQGKKISNEAWDGKSQSGMSQDIFVGQCMAHTKVPRNAVLL